MEIICYCITVDATSTALKGISVASGLSDQLIDVSVRKGMCHLKAARINQLCCQPLL